MTSSGSLMLTINPNSGTPIYRQVMEQVSRMVASGQLQGGDNLPSVRQLANYYQVNPMTISKAYSQLENEGTIERVRGIGMRVVANKKAAKPIKERIKLLDQALENLVIQCKQLDIPADQVIKELKQRLEAHHD